MTDETYNGWTNKPTWLANMYLQGNYDGEGTYLTTLEVVDQAVREAEPADKLFTEEQQRTHEIAIVLKDHFESCEPEEPAGVFHDLMAYAAAIINWREIAKHWLADWVERQTIDADA